MILRRLSLFLIPGVLLLAQTISASDSRGDLSEAQVKTAFIFNFLKFIDLPSHSNDSDLVLCLAGETYLEQIRNAIDGKLVKGKTVRVTLVSKSSELHSCGAIFFTSQTPLRLNLKELKNSGILTIGEDAEFLKAGGIINMFIENESVRFEVDLVKAREEKISINAQLLKLAKTAEE